MNSWNPKVSANQSQTLGITVLGTSDHVSRLFIHSLQQIMYSAVVACSLGAESLFFVWIDACMYQLGHREVYFFYMKSSIERINVSKKRFNLISKTKSLVTQPIHRLQSISLGSNPIICNTDDLADAWMER